MVQIIRNYVHFELFWIIWMLKDPNRIFSVGLWGVGDLIFNSKPLIFLAKSGVYNSILMVLSCFWPLSTLTLTFGGYLPLYIGVIRLAVLLLFLQCISLIFLPLPLQKLSRSVCTSKILKFFDFFFTWESTGGVFKTIFSAASL